VRGRGILRTGGFLVTHGVYSGTEDFKDKVVRHLMVSSMASSYLGRRPCGDAVGMLTGGGVMVCQVERRLAPFFKGLRDHEDDWTDAQLYAAFHELPIPGPDAESPREAADEARDEQWSTKVMSRTVGSSDNLTVPIASRSRSQSYTSEGSNRSNSSTPSFGLSTSRSRSKTLSISSPKNPTLANTAGPPETNNPSRFVDGRCIEAVLYKHAVECPICFMYYPPFLNRTRCCDQDICSECFVQIKRADPHIPESHDTPGEERPGSSSTSEQLVSEPATCPFCKQSDFGVTYSPPPWRRGITYVAQPGSSTNIASPFSVGSNSSTVSLGALSNPAESQPASPPLSPSWKRRTMLPLGDPHVVTSDDIRPDWNVKLQAARAHAARRAAAATALHTAAFLLSNNETSSRGGGSSGSAAPGGYGRRFIRRAVREGSYGSENHGSSESPSPNRSGSGTPREESISARPGSLLAPGMQSSAQERDREREQREREQSMEDRLASLGFIPPRILSSSPGQLGVPNVGGRNERRSRIVDLEEMMLMEAIRLSLAEEEDRKRRVAEADAKNKKEEEEEEQAGGPSDGKGKSVDRSNGASSSSGVEDAGTGGHMIPLLGDRDETEGTGNIGKSAVFEVGSVDAREEAR